MYRLGILIFVLALAACGGGGSSAGPSGGGGGIPTTQYTSQLVFHGSLATRAQDAMRIPMGYGLRRPSAASTPVPIMVLTPVTSAGNIGSAVNGASGYGGVAEAIVTPTTTASPSVSFSSTNPNAQVVPTPTPQPGHTSLPLDPGAVGATVVQGNNASPNAQSSGTATATIGTPVASTATTTVYAYRAISLECRSPLNAGSAQALTYNGTSFVPAASVATADVYITGPACDIPSAEPYATLHFPGGLSVPISSSVAFCDVLASTWVNSGTSIGLDTVVHQNPDGSYPNLILLAKTRDGAHVFKMYGNGIQPYYGEYSGGTEVAGNSIDGF